MYARFKRDNITTYIIMLINKIHKSMSIIIHIYILVLQSNHTIRVSVRNSRVLVRVRVPKYSILRTDTRQ